MNFFSINIRGVGGAPKLASLKLLLESVSRDILLVHETMLLDKIIWETFAQLLPHWIFYAMNANGQSRGILVACNPLVANFSCFSTHDGIFMEGLVRGHCQPISVIDCYAPFSTRVDFWE
jgi:hypothetical protein